MTKLLVIDTETGGIDPLTDSLISLAAVVWTDGAIGPEFSLYVAENEIHLTDRAIEINGLRSETIRDLGLPPKAVVAQLKSFIDVQFGCDVEERQNVTLCGHNLGFDVSFLRRLFRLAGQHDDFPFSHRGIDTAGIVKAMVMAGWLPAVESSDEIFEIFHVAPPPAERHTALGDARATARLLSAIISALSNFRPNGQNPATWCDTDMGTAV